ncbi:MAG: ABC transporter permease [bacterium]
MSMLDGLRFQLYRLTHRREIEQEAEEEIAFHLAQEARQSAASAQRVCTDQDHQAARRHFGNVTYYREELRRMGGHWFLDELVQDARFAARSFRRTPAFTLVVVFTLAVGIGANTAIFSAVNTLLLRPLPFLEPARLMNVSLSAPAVGSSRARTDVLWPYPKFAVFRDGQTAFRDVTVWSSMQFTVRVGDDALRESGEFTDAHYFPLLGITPTLGRAFLPGDDHLGGPHVAVLGDALWHELYQADPSVRGKMLDVDGTPFEIIGVAPPSFRGLSGIARFWIPLYAPPTVWTNLVSDPYDNRHHVVARLRDGEDPAHAKMVVQQMGANVDAAYPVRGVRDHHMGAIAFELDGLRVDSRIRRTLLTLFGAVGLVLLIACANVANLFLVRASGRRREIATRLALGASRARIIRQLLVESVMLSAAGGVASIAVAWAVIVLLGNFQPAQTFRLQELGGIGIVNTVAIELDGAALAFTAALAIGTGILFGLVPALQATREALVTAIKEGDAPPDRRRRFNTRSVLVTGEIALAVVLLAGSGVMIRSLERLLAIDPGFETDNVLTMRVNRAPTWSRDSIARFYDVAIDRLARIPGVSDVAMIDCPPFAGCGGTGVRFPDRVPVAPELDPVAGLHWSTSTLFNLLHVPLLRGRTFDTGDRSDTRRVVVVSQSAARQFWPNQDPIGRPVAVNITGFDTAYVVGVVGDVRFGPINAPPQPDIYVSYYQAPLSFRMMLFLKTRGDPDHSVTQVRAALKEVAPGFPMYEVTSLSSRVASELSYASFSALLLSIFAMLALTLAVIGTYGVTSFVVAQRTRELGIRSALGATPRTLVRMVIRQGMTLAALGIAIGLVLAVVATRLLTSLLYEVRPGDPATLVGIVLLLALSMLGATWIPARKAVALPVVQALRAD